MFLLDCFVGFMKNLFKKIKSETLMQVLATRLWQFREVLQGWIIGTGLVASAGSALTSRSAMDEIIKVCSQETA